MIKEYREKEKQLVCVTGSFFIVAELRGKLLARATATSASSAEPFARPVTAPEITLAGQRVTNVGFAGMSPCCIGLFQMNFQVPPDTPSGNQPLVIKQGLVLANETTLPIQ